MLEIKNLTKIYKTKKSAEVRALDDVSVKFPETGMVFLLGKSGSGKSTLLNICGGLDNPTQGEVIIKGRSSIDFKQSDFDSYRNTFVGFIFQEYNILEEFTVEENIALALELQGKNKDKKAIEDLLEKVDLKGYSNRKPNTLSGGQKQRLAIARALIKSPEIIMADEPTGALDTATGKQVFDTLKKLSEETLVIVVSHDREFAENYANRIIELQDGKIISDVTRKNDTFIKTDEKETKTIEYNQQDTQFITSKLPLKHAIRFGISGLKSKKIRLVITILLCVISFIMFGILSTMTFYNEEKTFKQTLKDSDLTMIQLSKEYKYKITNYYEQEKNYESEGFGFGNFTKEELNQYKEKYGTDVFPAVSTDYTISVHKNSNYWISRISYVAYLPTENQYRKNMIGKYPNDNNQIAITSYHANTILNLKMDDLDTGKTLQINSINDLIGKKIKLRDSEYTITGIIDSGEINSKFDSIKTSATVKDDLYESFNKMLEDNLHLIIFVTEQQLNVIAQDNEFFPTYSPFSDRDISISPMKENSYNFESYPNGTYASYKDVGTKYEVLKLGEYNNLNNNQAIANHTLFATAIIESTTPETLGEKTYQLAYEVYSGVTPKKKKDGTEYYVRLSTEEIKQKTKQLYNIIKNKNKNLKVGFKLFSHMDSITYGQTVEMNIVGVYISEDSFQNENRIIINDKIAKELIENQINKTDTSIFETNYINKGYYDVIYIPYNGSQKEIDMFWQIQSQKIYNQEDSKVHLTGTTINMLETVDDLIEDLSNIFLYGGIIIAVFASLLLSNFISISIANKRKEIGILRALGARSKDVFKIFFSESAIIAITCIILSSIVTTIICNVLNNALDLGVSVFVFGILSFLFIIFIAIITAVLATFIPVYKAARKKPIETIRAL